MALTWSGCFAMHSLMLLPRWPFLLWSIVVLWKGQILPQYRPIIHCWKCKIRINNCVGYFICQFNWVKGCPVSWENITAGGVWEGISQRGEPWFNRVSKVIHPQEVRWASASPLGAWRMNFLLFFELRPPTFLPANLRALESHALGPWQQQLLGSQDFDSGWDLGQRLPGLSSLRSWGETLSEAFFWFSSLQAADYETLGPP